MKKNTTLMMLAAATLLLTGCQEKKENKIIIAPKEEVAKPQGPQVMQNLDSDISVDWLGKTYRVVVNRKVDRELPMVEVESGRKAYDNRITLQILRADGSEFFKRDFTKAAFASSLDEQTRQTGVLLGIVLDRAEGDNLVFAASVGSPDELSDEYVPLVLTVSRMGNVSIARDTTMDTNADVEANGDDEDGV